MKEIIEKLDNGLQVSCQIPKGLAVAFYISLIKEALASGKFVICVLSEIEPKTLIEKLRERGIDEKNLKQIRCIDWYSWQTETVISVESIEQGFRCARDTINLQIALNKVLKSKKEREKIAIIEMVDRCWELFGELETIETLIKFQNKLRKQGILSFYTITKTKSTEILSRFSAAVKISERSGKVKCELQKQEEKIEIRYRLKDGVFEPYSEENGLERSVEIEVCPECGAYLQPDEEKCAVCGAVITPMKEEDGEKERHKFHFVLCTNCGAFVNEDAVRCSVCGAELLAGEEEEGAVTEIQSKDEKEGIFICSNCGAFVSAKAKKCEICGASLEAEETEEALVQVNIPAEPGIDEKSVYVCMQCGAFVDAERKNCPICGAEIAISEKVPQKALERVLETSLTLPSICPRCGAFVRAGENCSICGDIGKQMVHAKVNGLINGVREKKIVGKEGLINGFVNGRVNGKIPAKVSVKRGRRKEKQKLWRKVAGFLAVFIVVAAGLLSILLFVQYPGITVDGKFEDWEGTTIYENPVYSLQNPSVEIGKYGVHLYRNYLSFYVEVRDAAMLGKAFNETDAFFMFVDADESASTGYAISGIGADYMAVFSGWDCAVKSASAYQWNSSRNQTDFNGFESKYSGKGAVDGQRFEGQFTLTQPASIPRIVFYAQDNYGNRSRGQAVVSTHPGAIVITQSNPQHGIVNHSQNVELLHLSVETKAKENWIRQINVSIAGNASATDFDGIELRAGNNVVAGNYTDGMFRFNVSMPLEKNSEMEIGIYARLNSSAIGKSVGLRIPSRSDVFVENGTATLYSSFIGNTYVETVPQEIVIDGAFADWQNVMLNTDTENDTFPPGRFVWPSVDIAKYGMVDMENVSFYLSTYGVVLAGEELPMIVERPSEVVTPPPPEVPVLEGMDALFVFIDIDGNRLTGFRVYRGEMGAEYMIMVTGKNNTIYTSEVYHYETYIVEQNWTYWTYMGNVSAAIGSHEMECALPKTILQDVGNRSVIRFATKNWFEAGDWSDSEILTNFMREIDARVGEATSVVINEVYLVNLVGWIEVANPLSVAVDISGWTLQARVWGLGRWWWIPVYSFPSNTILQPFTYGYDYEYLRAVNVDLSPFESVERIRLRANQATIDEIRPLPTSGQNDQIARFKHEDNGIPIDTNADTDWYSTTLPTQTEPNDRKAPNIVVGKFTNVEETQPGGLITYTIYYNNTGDGNAKEVWINDTLPDGVAFVSSSIPYTSTDGRTYRWYFGTVVYDSQNALTITVQVNATVGDGVTLTNVVDLTYKDQLRRSMPSSQASAQVLCRRPNIVVEKVVDKTVASYGEILTYTIYYNNTGAGIAGHVWINDTLPDGVDFVSASDGGVLDGNVVRWHFTNVAPGSHYVTLQVSVNVTQGTLTNWAFLNYTSLYGVKFQESSDSANTTVVPEIKFFGFIFVFPLIVLVRKKQRFC